MQRGLLALAIALAALVSHARRARADEIADSISDLQSGDSYKVRLNAALALSKNADDRAVFAVAAALLDDSDKSVRRVCALALKKMVTAKTGIKARKEAMAALKDAKADKDKKVRKQAGKTLAVLEAMFATKAPKVFVNVDKSKDKTKKAPSDAVKELDRVVKSEVGRASSDYATEWDGGLPTSSELAEQGTSGVLVHASVTKVDVSTSGKKSTVQCSVEIRIAPWSGTDGEEKWAADQMGKATGSGKATTGSSEADVAEAVVDCVSTVAEQVTDDQVVPFIRRLIAGS